MRDMTNKEIGPYQCLLKVGDTQSMCFKKKAMMGHFIYVPATNCSKRKYGAKDKLEQLAKKYKIELTSEVEFVEEG